MNTPDEFFIPENEVKNRLRNTTYLYCIWIFLSLIAMTTLSACSSDDNKKIHIATTIVEEHPDSAYILLKDIDYYNLRSDGDKAEYILTKAKANMYLGRSLMSDTLLQQAITYYTQVADTTSMFQALVAQAHHLRSIEQSDAANVLMDSVYNIASSTAERRKSINKILLDFSFRDKNFNRSLYLIDRHLSLLNDEDERFGFEIKKITPLNSLGRSKDAIALCDSLFGLPSSPEIGSPDWLFLRMNYAASLGENSSTAHKAIEIMGDVIHRFGKASDRHLLELYIPMVNLQINAGNLGEAQKYIGFIANLDIDREDYDVVAGAYLDFLKIVLDYEKTGVLSSSQLSNVAHNLRRVSNNLEIKKQERDDALESAYDLSREKYELTISHQRLWLVLSVVILIAVIATSLITYVSYRRRQRLIDAEEKIETLEDLVKSAQNINTDDKHGLLKKILLQHLGIIKTFAESPTSQNQEALRKISNVGSADGNVVSLMKWNDFYPIIDELYDNFHSELITQFPNLFSDREINILCLIRAGFSTKEIGVLVEQTSNSIYVSKTSIRKKLEIGAKEDIMADLMSKFGDSGKS